MSNYGNRGSASKGAPVSVENAPKNLARRIKAWDNMQSRRGFSPMAFHRRGSQKKG